MGNKELAPVFLPAIKIEGGEVVEDEIETSMVGAGFQPTFYQFAETIIEVKMAITMSRETEYTSESKGEVKTTSTTSKWWNLSRKTVVTTTPIDASYSSKYNYTQEGSSLIRTRLVPVPPNSIIQRQLDMRSQAMQLMFELDMKKLELALEEKKQALMKEIDEL
jgi:hypothetical protein